MEPAPEPSALDRLERAEGEVSRITGAVASLIQLSHQNQQQLQQQQQQLAQVLEALTNRGTLSTAPPQPVADASASNTPAQGSPSPAPETSTPEPKIGDLERFNGDPTQVRPFLTNCRLLFSLQPRTFASEGARVGFTITHLTGRARLWGAAEFEQQTPACATFEAFAKEMTKVFDLGSSATEASQELLTIRQGDRTVADYSIEFRTLARRSSWNMAAVVDAFLHSLAEYIKDELVSHDVPSTLDDAISLVIRIDRRIQTRRREKGRQNRHAVRNQSDSSASRIHPVAPLAQPTQSAHSGQPEPMEIGRASLTPEERQRRFSSNLCLYCGGENHRVRTCPVKAKAHQA